MPFHVVLAPEQCQCHFKDCSSSSLFFRLWHTLRQHQETQRFCRQPRLFFLVIRIAFQTLLWARLSHTHHSVPQYNFLYLEWWFKRWRLKIYLSRSCCFPSPEICLPISLDSLCFILLKLRCGIKPFWVLNHILWPHCRASRVVR